MEIERVKAILPAFTYIGLADGAKDNWTYLLKYAQVDILNLYHATEYLTKASTVLNKGEQAQQKWVDKACHDLKHKKNGNIQAEALSKTITYLENNLMRMNYAEYQKKGYPIGSGVTEAGCKTVVKQRLCQ